MSGPGLLKKGQVVLGPRRSSVAPPKRAVVAMPAASPAPVALASVPAAPAVSDEELRRIRDAARREGLQQGLDQARKEAAAAQEARQAELGRLMQSASDAWDTERRSMLDLVADVAFVAVNRLLGDSLRDPAHAVAAVQAALAQCETWQAVTLDVHPQEAGLMRQALRDVPPGVAVQVVGSPEVPLGGCRIRSTHGQLDARLDVQLAMLRERLDQWRLAREAAA